MDRLLNALKGQGAQQDQASGAPRFGLVTSVDPASGTARVTLQPEGVLTGWLPLLSPWVGAGWGLASFPSPGDQVLVIPQEGDAEHGLVLAGAWSGQALPPAAPVGEFWLVHKSGASLKLQNDGTIRINGNLFVTGDISDSHGPLSRLRTHYNAHVHPPQNALTSQPD